MGLFNIASFLLIGCLGLIVLKLKTLVFVTHKHTCLKQKIVVKKSKFKNSFLFSNATFCVNGKAIKNYKIAFTNCGVKLFKCVDGGVVVITIKQNYMLITLSKLNKFNCCFYSNNNFKVSVKNKTENLKIKKQIYYYNYKCAINLKSISMQNQNNGLILKFFNFLPTILHTTKKFKKTLKLFNQKVVKIVNSSVLIKNYNQPLKNVFNIKLTSVLTRNNKTIVNKKFIVETQGEYLKIGLINSNFSCKFSLITDLKIQSKNQQINNLINNFLPSRIISEYLNNFSFNSLQDLIMFTDVSNCYFKHEINNLLNKKQYLKLYAYLLKSVIGVNVFTNSIQFFKPQFFIGPIQLSFNNIKLLINNNVDDCSFLYDGVVYNNVPVLKTTKTKPFNIDKIV